MACGSVVRGKNLFCFHLIENFVPLNCVRKCFHSEKKRKTSFSFAFRSLIRNIELCSNLLTFGKIQINLFFLSLIRNFEFCSNLLSLG